jgi:hypothetical protein
MVHDIALVFRPGKHGRRFLFQFVALSLQRLHLGLLDLLEFRPE